MSDDPLSFLAAGSRPVASAAPAAGETGEATLFRAVDATKMKDRPIAVAPKQPVAQPKQAESPALEKASQQQATGAAKGLGFGVDLWSETTSKPKGSSLDVLFTESSSAPLDAGIFTGGAAAAAAAASSSSSAAKKTNVDEAATGRVRVGVSVASDESQFGDLTMASRLLEREEELDYATFGKATHATQLREKVVSKVQSGAARGDLELESEDVLTRMEGALASQKDDALFKPKVGGSAAAGAAASRPAEVEVDLASMDLNSYIASQEQSGGGGLFD